MIAPATTASTVYQLKLTLRNTRPPIWRRLLVPANIRLAKLHLVLQLAMGWENCHLHKFVVSGHTYGEPDPDYDSYGMEMLDHRKFALCDLLTKPRQRLQYLYDFGDGWDHELLLEKILPADPTRRYPVCLAGARACPLEDSGGLYGYYEKLAIIKNPDPDNVDHQQIVAWVPEGFDPAAFDLAQVNRCLQQIK